MTWPVVPMFVQSKSSPLDSCRDDKNLLQFLESIENSQKLYLARTIVHLNKLFWYLNSSTVKTIQNGDNEHILTSFFQKIFPKLKQDKANYEKQYIIDKVNKLHSK